MQQSQRMDESNTVSFRPPQPNDAGTIAELSGELGYTVHEDHVRDTLNQLREREDHFILVAEYSSRAIGYIHCEDYMTLYTPRAINVLGIVVSSLYRNRGIGCRLLAEAENWAVSRGASLIRLNSGIDRIQAHRFYEREGYLMRKDQRSFYKILDQ